MSQIQLKIEAALSSKTSEKTIVLQGENPENQNLTL
jgi:hypothetical protein